MTVYTFSLGIGFFTFPDMMGLGMRVFFFTFPDMKGYTRLLGMLTVSLTQRVII